MTEPQDTARPRRHRRRADRVPDTAPGGVERTERGGVRQQSSERLQSDSRPTQLPFTTAMRAREVARPTDEDLADAAENVTLVRRHYVPPSPTG